MRGGQRCRDTGNRVKREGGALLDWFFKKTAQRRPLGPSAACKHGFWKSLIFSQTGRLAPKTCESYTSTCGTFTQGYSRVFLYKRIGLFLRGMKGSNSLITPPQKTCSLGTFAFALISRALQQTSLYGKLVLKLLHTVRKTFVSLSLISCENSTHQENPPPPNLPNLSSASPAPSVPPAPSARVAGLRTGEYMAALHMAELDAGQKAPKTKRSPWLRLKGLAFGQVDLPGTVCEKIWGDRDFESSRELGIGGWIWEGRGLGGLGAPRRLWWREPKQLGIVAPFAFSKPLKLATHP